MGDPAPKDRDFLVLPDTTTFHALATDGWAACGEGDYAEASFQAFRKGADNIIVMKDAAEFYRFLIAFYLCKKYRIYDKVDRVAVHPGLRLAHKFIPATFDYAGKQVWCTGLEAR